MTDSRDRGIRAAIAESAVLERFLHRLWALPGTRLGRVGAPPTIGDRMAWRWHYWWQAHLLDCLVDAQLRDPRPWRAGRIRDLGRGIHLRNGLRWHNDYYDDMAWLALALDRAQRRCGLDFGSAVPRLVRELTDAWTAAEGDGLPWRRRDDFRNLPANGPAAILLARTGNTAAARAICDWIEHRLLLTTGLLADGWRAGIAENGAADGIVEDTVYSYGQGVALGAELELAVRGDVAGVPRVVRLVAAVDAHLTRDGVLTGHGGGNGGLFTGILARYLAAVALRLPGPDDPAVTARAAARRLVLESADAAWAGRLTTPAGPVFSADWTVPAARPGGRPGRVVGNAVVEQSGIPERDLSVQLAGWMLLEAAAALDPAPS